MKLANLDGRLVLVVEGGAVDIEQASLGQFGPDPQSVYDRWTQFRIWVASALAVSGPKGAVPLDERLLGPPVPGPRQIFAIALNYRSHAAETGLAVPDSPAVFTKFMSSLSRPYGTIPLVDGHVDWEAEVVAVVGLRARNVREADGWDYIAGLTVGQDISERRSQLAGPVPQFSLAKSFPSFGPIGPWVVTTDEFGDRDDLVIGCTLNGEAVQKGRTSDLIFSVPALVARLSAVLELLPGDLIFTGTPSGIGMARDPQRFLADGDELVTTVEGIGSMRHRLAVNRRAS